MEQPKLVCLAVKNIGPGKYWPFGIVVLDGKDVVFFRAGGRKIFGGRIIVTSKEETKPKIGDSLLCQIECRPDGRLRAVRWTFANSNGGVH